MNLPKQIWDGEGRLFQCISAQIWLKNKGHREMIAETTPKPVSIIGSFGVALVFTLGFNHVWISVNDWFVVV
jgi:hypothetical protein